MFALWKVPAFTVFLVWLKKYWLSVHLQTAGNKHLKTVVQNSNLISLSLQINARQHGKYFRSIRHQNILSTHALISLSIDQEPTTWPANHRLQIMVAPSKCVFLQFIPLLRNCHHFLGWKMTDRFLELSEWFKYENNLGDRMIKRYKLNSALTKDRDLSVPRGSIIAALANKSNNWSARHLQITIFRSLLVTSLLFQYSPRIMKTRSKISV